MSYFRTLRCYGGDPDDKDPEIAPGVHSGWGGLGWSGFRDGNINISEQDRIPMRVRV
jgi:hypothetical protein